MEPMPLNEAGVNEAGPEKEPSAANVSILPGVAPPDTTNRRCAFLWIIAISLVVAVGGTAVVVFTASTTHPNLRSGNSPEHGVNLILNPEDTPAEAVLVDQDGNEEFGEEDGEEEAMDRQDGDMFSMGRQDAIKQVKEEEEEEDCEEDEEEDCEDWEGANMGILDDFGGGGGLGGHELIELGHPAVWNPHYSDLFGR
jgi:hypothetical protein